MIEFALVAAMQPCNAKDSLEMRAGPNGRVLRYGSEARARI